MVDFQDAVRAFHNDPEQARARSARREARSQAIHSRIAEALGKYSAQPAAQRQRREAAGWNIQKDQLDDDGGSAGQGGSQVGRPMGEQHPGAAAILVVRHALSEYKLPNEPELRYHGMDRRSGHGAYHMDEGTVWIQASLQSMSGPQHHIDIPVMVHDGRLLAPSILRHEGNFRVITQHTLDDIVDRGEFSGQVPDRRNMFAPPPEEHTTRKVTPLLRPGVFTTPPRALIASAVRGGYQAAGPRKPKAPITPTSYNTQELYRTLLGKIRQLDPSLYDAMAKGAMPRGEEQTQASIAHLQKQVDALEKQVLERALDTNQPFEDVDHSHIRDVTSDVDVEGAEGEYRQTIEPGRGGKPSGHWQSYAKNPGTQHLIPSPSMEQDDARSEANARQQQTLNMSRQRQHQAFYSPDLTGLVKPGQHGADIPGAGGSHLDPAERPTAGYCWPTMKVRTTKEVTVRDQGGVGYTLPRGSSGTVIRDTDGTNRAIYVRFAELGYSAVVARDILSKSKSQA